MNSAIRVVVTGMGTVSPFGVGVDKLWESIKSGKSAVARIASFDPTGIDSQVAAEVKDFNPEDFIAKKEIKKQDKFLKFSNAATKLCFNDSGLQVNEELSPYAGVVIGSGIGGMNSLENTHVTLLEKGPSRVSPFFIPMMLINMAAGMAAMDYGFRGPNLSVVAACASGSHSIGIAYDQIKYGRAKVMIAGGSESAITQLTVSGFSALKALSCRNDEPERASRPFDKKRDGFVIGEGSAIMILEELSHALARGAKIYAELVGFGTTADGYHITQPDPEGKGAVEAMRMAINEAGIKPELIDYINAHGTSTPLGDIAETNAIKRVFGDHAKKLAVSSTKSMHGHLLGAAGALEAIITVLALRDNILPPTINLEEPDPECDLDYVPNVSRKCEVNYAISNSFGFGGTNSVLVFKKYRSE